MINHNRFFVDIQPLTHDGRSMIETTEIGPEVPKEAPLNNVTPINQKAQKSPRKKRTQKIDTSETITIREKTVRTRKQAVRRETAARNLESILALWVSAVRRFAAEVWHSYVAIGFKSVKKFLKKIGNFILSLVNLDSPDKVDLLLDKSREVAKGAGQQALAAALMALLTALADGARVAMSELIKDSSSKILHAIVEGAAEGFSESSNSSPNTFRHQTVSSSPFNNNYNSRNSYDSTRPPWAT